MRPHPLVLHPPNEISSDLTGLSIENWKWLLVERTAEYCLFSLRPVTSITSIAINEEVKIGLTMFNSDSSARKKDNE